jgi:oxygen-independent coproporphyrinogen-3 oxidase
VRHVRPGPRYTSYPPATEFTPSFGPTHARATLERLDEDAPLSLYVHVPFCARLCWYCGCNVEVTRNRDRGRAYVDTLIGEIDMIARVLGTRRRVVEIALGGGSPNFLPESEHTRLLEAIRARFDVAADAVLGIELDPRDTTHAQVANLAALGFRRLSVGVQDFAPVVQTAIHRHQSLEVTRGLIEHARSQGFTSVNIDLVYGLPGQTETSMLQTLFAVLSLGPDQVALFGYAHLPERFRHQKLVERWQPVPDLDQRAALFVAAQDAFDRAGYVRIGIDHFARAHAPLARAAQRHNLQRSFQGYGVRRADHLLAFGASGISRVDGAYWQSHADVTSWTQAVRAGRMPVARGVALDRDDRIRGDVIAELMCYAGLDFAAIERQHGIRFEEYFASELDELSENHGNLVAIDRQGRRLHTSPLGADLLRNVCMVFDRYVGAAEQPRFSPTL